MKLKSQALASGIVQDSTRCAGCRAVKRTHWTRPPFALHPILLIAHVEEEEDEKEEEEDEEGHLSETFERADRETMTSLG